MEGLELTGVSFRAAKRKILDRVSLAVAPGSTMAILGPSGSGKTTLLRVVAGLERSESGSVSFDNTRMDGVPPHRRGFGMMFQDHALFPHMSVEQNIEFGLRQSHWEAERRKSRVREMLDLVGLPGFGARTIEKLSGGERQRVALARALAPQPKLLMLDEPLGSLDRELRERLASELRSILTTLGITALYVTHDQDEAFTVADRIAILDAGRVVGTGTPREVWSEPRTAFVARFLGLRNVVEGRRRSDGSVETPFGIFGPVPGPVGAVTVLLRPEGTLAADSSGQGIASGILRASTFRGSGVQLVMAAGGQSLVFELPADAPLPAIGSEVHITVPSAQALLTNNRPD